MTPPPTDRNQALRDALEPLLQNTGDAIADMFDQLTRGNWRDDHGHNVKLNAQMIALQDTLMDIASFRTKHLGYKDVDPRPAMQEPASEPAPACDHVWGVGDYCVACLKCGVEKVEPAPASAPSCCGEDEKHPDDLAVDRFAIAMKEKLQWAREVRGRGGWDDPSKCSVEYLAKLLVDHLPKGNAGNFEDIANLAMMLHQRQAKPSVIAAEISARAQPCQCWELREALKQATRAEFSNARRMRAAIVEARKRLAKGRALWNGPAHECDAVLEQALRAWNDLPASEPCGGCADDESMAGTCASCPRFAATAPRSGES